MILGIRNERLIQEWRLRLFCWLGSCLFHLVLISFGAFFFLKHAPFIVKPGDSSTEIVLITEPKPATPSIPRPPQAPPPQPVASQSPQPTSLAKASLPALQKEIVSPPKPAPAPASSTPNSPHSRQVKASSPIPHSSSVSAGIIQAQPDDLHNEPPVYPEESEADHEEGVVILRVDVTAEGLPESIHLLKSSGYFRLDQAARQAVEHWKFHPATLAGIPVRSEVDTPVHFKLQ